MKDLPLKKLRNFGGKLGAELGEMNCTTAGEVAALPHKALVARFGEERATFIARAVRGYSDEPVQARHLSSQKYCLLSAVVLRYCSRRGLSTAGPSMYHMVTCGMCPCMAHPSLAS